MKIRRLIRHGKNKETLTFHSVHIDLSLSLVHWRRNYTTISSHLSCRRTLEIFTSEKKCCEKFQISLFSLSRENIYVEIINKISSRANVDVWLDIRVKRERREKIYSIRKWSMELHCRAPDASEQAAESLETSDRVSGRVNRLFISIIKIVFVSFNSAKVQ